MLKNMPSYIFFITWNAGTVFLFAARGRKSGEILIDPPLPHRVDWSLPQLHSSGAVV